MSATYLQLLITAAASVARHLYIRSPCGVKGLVKVYGGRQNNGTCPSHFCGGSSSVARKALQALEHLKIVEKDSNGYCYIVPTMLLFYNFGILRLCYRVSLQGFASHLTYRYIVIMKMSFTNPSFALVLMRDDQTHSVQLTLKPNQKRSELALVKRRVLKTKKNKKLPKC